MAVTPSIGTGTDSNNINLFNISTGEWMIENASYATYYDENKTIVAGNSDGGVTVIGEKFNLEFSKSYDFNMCNNSFWAFDKKSNKAYHYDLNGKIKNELIGVKTRYDLVDGYFMYVCEDGKTRVINTEDGNITIELLMKKNDTSYYIPYKFNKENIGIIESDDGLYKLNGDKVIEKD